MSKTIKKEHGIQYSLCIQGIFGRNRKSKFEVVKLRTVAVEMDDATITLMATQALADIKAKPGCVWRIEAHPHTLETIETEDGTQFKLSSLSFSLGKDCSVLKGVV